MECIILALEGNLIVPKRGFRGVDYIKYKSQTYTLENVYFADWTPLRSASNFIVGFDIVTFTDKKYFNARLAHRDFFSKANNLFVRIELDSVIISIHLSKLEIDHEDDNQYIEAAIFFAGDSMVMCLDGISDDHWNNFAFSLDA